VRYCSAIQLRRTAIAVICLSPLLRLFLSWHGVDIYSNPFCRLDALMGGALLALVVRRDDFTPPKFTTAAWIVFGLAAPLALTAQSFDATWAVLSFTALASSSFVYLAIFSPYRWLQKALHTRFLIYTGTISYGLYLLHKIPIDMAQTFHLDRRPLLALPVLLLAAYALATLSRLLLEKPFLRWKRFFESKPGAADAGRGLPVAAATRGEPT
jgi:peptidoglycan/LPS O-acetylase OafA/YrhL